MEIVARLKKVKENDQNYHKFFNWVYFDITSVRHYLFNFVSI